MFVRDVLLGNQGENLQDCHIYRRDKKRAYKEGFNEFLDRSKEYIINGITYNVHENVNMYLDVSGKCNGKCRFCIAKTEYKRKEISYKEYISKFIKAYTILKNVNPSIQIVGGEPTIWEGLEELLYQLKNLKCRFPVLGTNGTGLNNYDIINNSCLEWINLSRHHYNENINYEIMGNNVLSNKLLQKNINNINKNIRLQCNMIGGYIDTFGEIMQMIAYAYHNLGIINIAFALLTPLPSNSFYQSKIIKYVKEHPVNCDSILDRIENDNRFVFEKYRGGVACYYEIWKYNAYEKPITVVFKYSDNIYLEKADKIENCIPDIIMHTDGTVCGSWNKGIKKLI